MSFDSLGLRVELLRAVAAQGYTEPTPIQRQAVPAILARRDVLAGAQTGTGKTAAFTLPLLQLLAEAPTRGGARRPRALVLTPTRELAAQVGESVRTYGTFLPLTAIEIFGGVGMQPQVTALRRGVDIVIATPGRLLDHAGQQTVDLGGIEYLVLDEADRMLDMGFIHDIRRVLKLLPARRQNLLFSATYSKEIEQLANGLLHDPARIAVAPRNTAAELVSQLVHPVAPGRKRELLAHLIQQGNWEQVLVFTRTKHGANRLAQQLERDGILAAAIHGNKSQGARTRALAGFKDGSIRVLVATDIAARGLDIDRLPHVVNYELPNVPEDYVHRIGRTGRAGAEGTAVSLVSADERRLLADIERVLGRAVERALVPGFEDLNTPGSDPVDAYEPRRGPGNAGGRGRPRAAVAPGQSGDQRGSGRGQQGADQRGSRVAGPVGDDGRERPARAHHPRPRTETRGDGHGGRGTRPGEGRRHGQGAGNGNRRRPAG